MTMNNPLINAKLEFRKRLIDLCIGQQQDFLWFAVVDSTAQVAMSLRGYDAFHRVIQPVRLTSGNANSR